MIIIILFYDKKDKLIILEIFKNLNFYPSCGTELHFLFSTTISGSSSTPLIDPLFFLPKITISASLRTGIKKKKFKLENKFIKSKYYSFTHFKFFFTKFIAPINR